MNHLDRTLRHAGSHRPAVRGGRRLGVLELRRGGSVQAKSGSPATSPLLGDASMKLSHAQLEPVVAAAIAKATEIRVPMNIAVLDSGGFIKSFTRMDGAFLASIDVAMKKAKTAVLFDANSEAAWEFCKPGGPAPGLELTNDVLVIFAGGIPLRTRDGELLGAIGISGGAVAQDVEVAQAAAAAFPA
ncbi:MAG: heme-binding protein [Dokdonella sp.]